MPFPSAKLCRNVASSPSISRAIHLTCHRCASRFLSSGHGFLHREEYRRTFVHPLADPGIGAARSDAQSEVLGAVLDAGQHLHDDRLLDHALLHLQQRPTDRRQSQDVLVGRGAAPFLRDCDIRHRRYRRCKFHAVNVLHRISLGVFRILKPDHDHR